MASAQDTYLDAANTDGRPLTGPKFLAMLLAAFAVIASVNGTMIYYALSTFRGEVDPHPYEHGLAYNKDIAAAEAQDARHWQVAAHIDGTGAAKTVEALFRDNAGQALAGLIVSARLEFATDTKRDHKLLLTEATPGSYRGALGVGSGQWDLVIEAKRAGTEVFLSRSRITIP
jgi:nitrogen fixation protein FixH